MIANGEEFIQDLARDVYLYAFPIVLMDVTMRLATSIPDSLSAPMRAPLNQFAHFKSYPDANARDIVRFNFDTLYSFTWVDLTGGPMVLSVPEVKDRYYVVPALDMWTDVFCSIGTRTTGSGAGQFAFVPPGWGGEVPADTVKIETPTSLIWIMGRVQTNGPSDFENVRVIQDGFRITPIDWRQEAPEPSIRKSFDSPVDEAAPPLMQVMKLSGVELFSRFAELISRFPPHPNDYPILFRMRALGLVPGQTWDPFALKSETANAINVGAKQAQKEMMLAGRNFGTRTNGWSIAAENMGTYGTSYLRRAVIALGGIGCNLPEDAIYPQAFVDAEGHPLDSANRYVLHFDQGMLPPANAFWSITMYDLDGFQTPNRIDRFAIGDRDDLRFNSDGSLDIYVQSESPGSDKESNWLPAPKSGRMAPTMRIYWPRVNAIGSLWNPPPFVRVG